MLKNNKKFLLLVLMFLLVFQPSAQATSEKMNNDSFVINGTAKITNLETGEVKKIKLTNIKELSTFNIEKNDNNYEKIIETTFKFPQISTSAEESVEKRNDVKAVLTINYDYSRSDDKIRINSFSGSWTPENKYILVDNRVTGCTDGRLIPIAKSITKYPTSNTFYYSTGWGYVEYYPVSDYSGPRAYSEARVIIPGMGNGYKIELKLSIDLL